MTLTRLVVLLVALLCASVALVAFTGWEYGLWTWRANVIHVVALPLYAATAVVGFYFFGILYLNIPR